MFNWSLIEQEYILKVLKEKSSESTSLSGLGDDLTSERGKQQLTMLSNIVDVFSIVFQAPLQFSSLTSLVVMQQLKVAMVRKDTTFQHNVRNGVLRQNGHKMPPFCHNPDAIVYDDIYRNLWQFCDHLYATTAVILLWWISMKCLPHQEETTKAVKHLTWHRWRRCESPTISPRLHCRKKHFQKFILINLDMTITNT